MDLGVRQTGPASPFRCGLGLGLSFYTCEMEVIPPTLQDCWKDEEQMEIPLHDSWHIPSGAE